MFPEDKVIKCQRIIRRWLSLKHKSTGLTIEKLNQLSSHINFVPPKTQLQHYVLNNAHPEIIKYVELSGKTFGEKFMEDLTQEWFKLDKRSDSSHDHKKCGKTIEQKSARYHANGTDWKWQHIEMNHQWDILLLCGLDYQMIRYFVATREVVHNLIENGIVTGQGKKENGIANAQQGYWFSRSDFKRKNKKFTDYFTEILSERDLIQFLEKT